MIRQLQNKDIDKIMGIWLESTIYAHKFISKEYWNENYNIVKDVYKLLERRKNANYY